MRRLGRLIPRSLVGQFVLAGGLVMAAGALVVGTWVANRIEQGVVTNSAVSSALFLEGFLSPLSSELADEAGLSEPARSALREVFFGTALGDRVVSYKIWKPGGRVVEASDASLIGEVYPLSPDQQAAWEGRIAASFEQLGDEEDAAEAALGVPLLEIYSPIREFWTGDIVAVAEVYERADALAEELADARRKSWLVVIAVFAGAGLLLFGIVQAGSRLIAQQRAALEARLAESRAMSLQLAALKDRVVAAAQRSTAQADRVMQRIGQDLHDGVAQHLSLASLRFEESRPSDAGNAETVRQALGTAMTELRAISRGLALPDIEQLDLAATIARAADDHRKAFNAEADVDIDIPPGRDVPYPVKLCAYRFVQEALANATRHAGAERISVRARATPEALHVTVQDDGKGFDAEALATVRLDGGQGLHGLRDRAETLDGRVEIDARPGGGTTLRLTLPIREDTP